MPTINLPKFLTAKPSQAPQAQVAMGGHRSPASAAAEAARASADANHAALLAQAKAFAKLRQARANAKLFQAKANDCHVLLMQAEASRNQALIPKLRASAKLARAEANAVHAKLVRLETTGNHAFLLAQAEATGNRALITLIAQLRGNAKQAQADANADHALLAQAEAIGNRDLIDLLRANATLAQAEADANHGLLVQAEEHAGEVARTAAAMQGLGQQIVAAEDALRAAIKRCEATQDVRQQLQALKAAADQLTGLRTKVFHELKLKPVPPAPSPSSGVQPAAPPAVRPSQPVVLPPQPVLGGQRGPSLPKFFSRHGL
jgi:hypothetical protein